MILRRHLFTNVCILFTVCLVILHVSELYNRTDLTLELNILILVFSLISFDFQILLSMRKATRAFWIRALVSSSVPPVLLILLPRYVKQSVSSSGFPSTVTMFLLFVLAFIILVLFILMAINGMVKRLCMEEDVGYVDLWDSLVGKEEMYARDGLHLSGKGAAVFAEGLSGAVASGLGKVRYLN